MKGKDTFTKLEIKKLEELILLRTNTSSSGQKKIRDKMRELGFFGRDDWGISNLQVSDLHLLIKTGRIRIISEENYHFKDLDKIKMDSHEQPNKIPLNKHDKDELYVLDLCDRILGRKCLRQHRFVFLLGDVNEKGKAVKLPVDGYYPGLELVIEYHERQHTEMVSFFDKPERLTISGVDRGLQRKIYDERRREVLRNHRISLIEIPYSDFNYDSNRRIIRNKISDESTIKAMLGDRYFEMQSR